MPRTNGVYAPPAGTKGVPNTTILSARYNALVEDITADANAPRPVTAGGTGATSASGAREFLGLAVGTNIQAYDALLQSIAGLSGAADQIIYLSGPKAAATTSLTAYGRTLMATASVAALKTTLSLAAVASSGSYNDLSSRPTLGTAAAKNVEDFATAAQGAKADAAVGVPIGASIFWNSTANIPAGFLKENGAAISRTTYAELFAIIGTTFGAGNGSTTFNLPDSRAEFIRGLDDGRGVDTGRTLGSSQADQNEAHTHSVSGSISGTAASAGSHAHNLRGVNTTALAQSDLAGAAASNAAGVAATRAQNGSGSGLVVADGAHTHGVSGTMSGTAASSGGTEARPRNVSKLVLIRAF